LLALAVAISTLPSAFAQPTSRVHRIAYLGPGVTSVLPAAHQAFRRELRQRGYIEGKNLTIEYRWAGGQDDRLPAIADELVRLAVDVIVVEGHTPAIDAVRRATKKIPIVMAVSGDPVGSGLVESLAHPGGNLTGFTILSPELAAKRLQVFKEAVPQLSRVAVLWNPGNSAKVQEWKETEAAARSLQLRLLSFEVRSPKDFAAVFSGATKQRPDALIAFSDGLINGHKAQIASFAAKARLPNMYANRDFVDAGGLISYGPNWTDLFRRTAIYVDKILRGAKPADLPIEQPEKFELVINLKAAKDLGLTIPKSVLLRADDLIQ
jgi:putative ABC transport system substrate-binding protein